MSITAKYNIDLSVIICIKSINQGYSEILTMEVNEANL